MVQSEPRRDPDNLRVHKSVSGEASNTNRRGQRGSLTVPFSGKLITSIREADLLSLIDTKENEGKEIDYKRLLPGKSDADRREFLYDVSSFANTSGGYLIFGIEERGG